MSQVQLSDVTKVCDDVLAVEGIHSAVRDGEFLAMVGLLPAGKSTTLRLIVALETPIAGELGIGDKVVTDVRLQDYTVATDSGPLMTGVDVGEPSGTYSFHYLHPPQDDGGIVACVDTEFHPEPGETLPLGIESVDAHFFGETGKHEPLSDESASATAL